LLAVEARDEAAAAHLTARFQGTQHTHQITPGQRLLFARHGFAEHDAGALQQLLGDEFRGGRIEAVGAQ
jgi:hypothetical protein